MDDNTTLTLTGALDIEAGTVMVGPYSTLQGVILLLCAHGRRTLQSGTTVSGATDDDTLTGSANNQALTIAGEIRLNGAGGAGPGARVINDTDARFVIDALPAPSSAQAR